MAEYEKEDDIVVSVDGGLTWPSIYEPEKEFQIDSNTAGGKFAASFPAADLLTAMGGLPDWVRINKDGLVRVRSNLRPEVSAKDSVGNKTGVDVLVRALARLDARNLSRDKVFEGQGADIVVRSFDYDFETQGRPMGLSIRGPVTRGSGTTLLLVSVKVYL